MEKFPRPTQGIKEKPSLAMGWMRAARSNRKSNELWVTKVCEMKEKHFHNAVQHDMANNAVVKDIQPVTQLPVIKVFCLSQHEIPH